MRWVVGLALIAWLMAGCSPAGRPAESRRPGMALPRDEAWMRAEMARRHPGQRPLNWAIAEAAERFRRSQPMGRFVLAVQRGQWGNDCSDFVECAIDEGLGVGARFKRGSRHHLLARDRRLFDTTVWQPGDVVQPGDVLQVRHSPWYAPTEDSAWHVGVVGPHGQVCDFTKLKRWRGPRYGRQSVAWFVRHSLGPDQVYLLRLKPRYRYRIDPLPTPRPIMDQVPAAPRRGVEG